ncbi:MAG: 3-dehydroquinate synthase [Firmicutes bacterium]|nr:3-dehydroquinate synthase [Bacillota bacterium]
MIIRMDLDRDGYDIVLQPGVLSQANQYLQLQRKVLLVTDDGVPAEYVRQAAACCREPQVVTLPQGEASKSMGSYQRLLAVMLENGFGRRDCVLAVGGGMVGDVSGFAAATYMRGVDFYNIPTTFLSQVDSSIGGKTAVNFQGVKNPVGAFHQPKKVLIDPDTLKTLEERQFNAGVAESVKMALTCDGELFRLLSRIENDPADWQEVIYRSLLVKKQVVESDPQENGLRRVLNFGHTVGHAIESFAQGRLLHGECVALGMRLMCGPAVLPQLEQVLAKFRLPRQVQAQATDLMPFLLHDKKMDAGGTVAGVYVEEIGSFSFVRWDEEQWRAHLEERL